MFPTRSCPFCGKPVGVTQTRCPYCRESIPAAAVAPRVNRVQTFAGRNYMRRGFLYALLAGIIYFFAAGYSGMTLPVAVPPFVNQILTPLLFLAGLGMILYGAFLYLRA
ncbi:MAG TPA: hypothetical protein VKP58_09590 [Candidatus Acidoferrum sp.]|nr:hypothetical protein [Candidatus Acidoferrum sp.]